LRYRNSEEGNLKLEIRKQKSETGKKSRKQKLEIRKQCFLVSSFSLHL